MRPPSSMVNTPHQPQPDVGNRSAAERLARVPRSDLPLATGIGTVGLFAEDGQTVYIRAGGRQEPATRFGPVRVNRIAVDIARHYVRDEHGDWQPLFRGAPTVFRADTAKEPTPAVKDKVHEALAAALAAWADANPVVLAAAQHAAYGRDIAHLEAQLRDLNQQRRTLVRQIGTLERTRQRHATAWAPHVAAETGTKARPNRHVPASDTASTNVPGPEDATEGENGARHDGRE